MNINKVWCNNDCGGYWEQPLEENMNSDEFEEYCENKPNSTTCSECIFKEMEK
tara:strand:+ start:42 stop:200 length:159 start_codon:yes stop_codon:yes gene_type:complete